MLWGVSPAVFKVKKKAKKEGVLVGIGLDLESKSSPP
jgi:hypothetical protein